MFLQQFAQFWKKHFAYLSPANTHLIVAVSGGLDSVVLADVLYKSGFSFTLAHCNFGLRGAESDRDEAFVQRLANTYKQPFAVARFDTQQYAAEHKLSIQEAARNLRYQWFQQLVAQVSPSTAGNFIATAHHANDNIETLLINFFRGTGIGGLHGILPRQNNIIRPLLFAKREEIKAYAKEQKLSWVEDSSNASDKYTRNFIRHKVLPMVTEVFASAEDNLLQNIERLSEAGQLYNEAVALHKKKLVQTKGNEVHIPVLKLQKTAPLATLVWEIVKDYGFTSAQVADIKPLLMADNGKYVASATHRIIKNRGWLIVAPLQTQEARTILIEKNDAEIIYENGCLSISKQAAPKEATSIPANPYIAMLDARHIQYPLLLRKWQQGDYFYPLGMKKKKKLSKFFIDNKLSKTDKEWVWVLEMNKKIVWVVGYRIDDRFKLEPTTETAFVIVQKT